MTAASSWREDPAPPPPGGSAAEADENGAASLLVSTFLVNGTLFALDTASVEEVVRLRRITRVGHSPARVLGVMNLRGNIITVLDLAQMLQLGRSAAGDESRLYIVPDGDGTAALLVDRAADVIEVDPDAIEPPPGGARSAEGRIIRGIFRSGNRLITILDAAALLAGEDL